MVISTTGIAYLGPPGTYCEEASRYWQQQLAAAASNLLPQATVAHVVAAVKERQACAGVVPLENSIEGSVNLTLDLLYEEKDLKIQGEIIVRVEHVLAGRAGLAAGDVTAVYSHPQALAQCRHYLVRHFPGVQLVPTASTAEAAQLVLDGASQGVAIVSRAAARRYELQVLAAGISDYPENKTRFVVIGRGLAPPTGRDKTSLVLALPDDRPGRLYQVLEEFAVAGINLTKIESRPAKKGLGDYIFYLDCEGHVTEPQVQGVLQRIRAKTSMLEVLGAYPRYREAGEGNNGGTS